MQMSPPQTGTLATIGLMRFGGHSRRSFLASALSAARFADQASKEPVPSEARRYQDPITDLDVYRLTDPGHASLLPAYYSRALTRNGGGLLFSSDRSGTPQVYFMDLKTGESRQLTEAAADLDPTSPTFTPDTRSFAYFRGAHSVPRQPVDAEKSANCTRSRRDGSGARA